MKVLVVEDETPIRNLCERVLKRAGHETGVAACGAEALPRLAENWDVVLTDLTMPGAVDGLEVLRQAKERSSADVILMTAYPEMNTAVEAMRFGAYDYLIKPFSLDALSLTVGRCLDKRRLSTELAREKDLRAQLQRAHAELVQLESVKETFGQFATPEVVKLVLDSPADFLKRGARKVVTVLFADVRGFTPFSSRVPPEEAVETLNAFFSCAVEAINSEGGILNKFVGDGMMAIFGAPASLENHAASAARAALKACSEFEALARARRRQGKEALTVCLGLNTGEVIAGCLGTPKRTEYSVIGHPVNVASRLEGANKFFGSRIMASEATCLASRGEVEARELGRIRPVGESAPIRVFELLAEKGRLSEEWKRALPLYELGLARFDARRYAEASVAFRRMLEVSPGDGPARFYSRLATEYEARGPAAEWDGAFDLRVK